MDEHELSRRVLTTAHQSSRPGFREGLWGDLVAEIDGDIRPEPKHDEDSGAPVRRWAVVGIAAATIIAAVGAAVVLGDDGDPYTDTVPTAPPTVPRTSPTTTAPTTAVPTVTTKWHVPTVVDVVTGHDVALSWSVDCAAGSIDCRESDLPPGDTPEITAFVGGDVNVDGLSGNVTVRSGTSQLAAIPNVDDGWHFVLPSTFTESSKPITVVIRDERADGSSHDYPLNVRPGERSQNDAPASSAVGDTIPEAPAAPDELPRFVYASRRLEGGSLVRFDRLTGNQDTIVRISPSDSPECADGCGTFDVSPSADGEFVVYGGPGPATGQLFTVPTDGSTDPRLLFAGGNADVSALVGGTNHDVAPDGTVAADRKGTVLVGPHDAAEALSRPLGSTPIIPAYSPDGGKLYVVVTHIGGQTLIEADPHDPTRLLRAIRRFESFGIRDIAVTSDGTIVYLFEDGTGASSIGFVAPDGGAVPGPHEFIQLHNGAGDKHETRTIDMDPSGRYLLFTDGVGRLRWTDFEQVGSVVGDLGWGDGGW